MPIVDVQVVVVEGASVPDGTAKALADKLATVFASPPGRVWVRLALLPASFYAENDESASLLPVFLRVLLADLPPPEVLATRSQAIAGAVAACLNRQPELVHVEYAPPGRGRVAFGGELLR
jgi:hypothetical protein